MQMSSSQKQFKSLQPKITLRKYIFLSWHTFLAYIFEWKQMETNIIPSYHSYAKEQFSNDQAASKYMKKIELSVWSIKKLFGQMCFKLILYKLKYFYKEINFKYLHRKLKKKGIKMLKTKENRNKWLIKLYQ